MRFLPLIAVVVLVFGATGFYVGLRIVNPLGLPLWPKVIAWILVLLPATLPAWLMLDRLDFGRWLGAAIGLVYVMLGVLSFLAVLALLRDCIWLIIGASHNFLAFPYSLPSYAPLMRFSSLAVVVLAVLLSGTAVINALSFPPLKRISLAISNLHPDLEGLRIVQLSDIHLGHLRRKHFLQRIVDTVNRVSPDLTVITGDLTDGSVKSLGGDVRPLADIEADCLFVTGNHEYYWTAEDWLDYLEELGLVVLKDSHFRMSHGEASILIVGISDPTTEIFFPQAASGLSVAAPRELQADFSLLLAHRPGTAYKAVRYGFDLQLSGHTHGGQFFPWNYVIHAFQPFAVGLYRYQDMWVYCSRGTGFWGPPMRLGAPAEITEFTLRRE
jgi:predicted MPP superfamily phosphohydrolase